MDNLTHSLAGMLLAEAALALPSRRHPTSRSFRIAAYLVSVFANNAPDLDFLYTRITDPPIGYLLHHRGHSHTLPIAIAITVATIAVSTAVARRRGLSWTRDERLGIALLAALGPLVHMAMDFSNNYGVHPFWPFYDGWIYGDAVFIVEPFFWAVAIPPLVFAAHARVTRVALVILLVAGVTLCWVLARASTPNKVVPVPMAAMVTPLAACATLAAWKSSPPIRVVLGVVGSWTVAAIFFAATGAAAAQVRRSPHLAGTTIDDVVITPMPANPLCATALVVGTRGVDYVVERATVASVPAFFPASRCTKAFDGDPTAPRSLVVSPIGDSVAWKDEFRAPLEELVELARHNCQAAAFLRFARVPYWARASDDELIIGDLRFDRVRGLDFSDVRIPVRPAVCPRALPPWKPPRSRLIGDPG